MGSFKSVCEQVNPMPLPLIYSRVRTAALEHCVKRQSNQSQEKSRRALANITMLLMQKYLKPDGVVGIDNTRWQADPILFLSATQSVSTVQELKKVSQAFYAR